MKYNKEMKQSKKKSELNTPDTFMEEKVEMLACGGHKKYPKPQEMRAKQTGKARMPK